MAKYRKKPVVIEAVQFVDGLVNRDVGTDSEEAIKTGRMFLEYPVLVDKRGHHLIIPTMEGNHRADAGDWIITGVQGERYPCKPDIFEQTYEPAE